jgi:multisubunit Na+/H+ antiporter MnhG subunit
MKAEENVSRHPGITIHKMPIAGSVGGFIFAVGIVVLAVAGLPFAKWFLLGAVILGVGVVGVLRFFRKLHPQTEVEELQFNVGSQPRQK